MHSHDVIPLSREAMATATGGLFDCAARGYQLGQAWDHNVVRSALLDAPLECALRPVARALGSD